MRILDLVARGDIRVSEHGYDRLAEDEINLREVVQGVREGQLIEEYPDYAKGPCILVLQRDRQGKAIHVFGEFPVDAIRRRW
jgi:hypothetical protein